jgi:hypothetical protein
MPDEKCRLLLVFCSQSSIFCSLTSVFCPLFPEKWNLLCKKLPSFLSIARYDLQNLSSGHERAKSCVIKIRYNPMT